MARATFKWDDRQLNRNLKTLPARFENAVTRIVDFHASMGEAYMKSNAPWTDRTSAARNGLFTTVEHAAGGKTWGILFSHSVTYGIWLEVAHSGKYAIIMPSVRSVGARLMSDLNGTLDRMG